MQNLSKRIALHAIISNIAYLLDIVTLEEVLGEIYKHFGGTKMQDRVKPCPFCGGTDIEIYESADSCGRDVHYTVECFNSNCDPYKKTEKEAIDFWNARSE